MQVAGLLADHALAHQFGNRNYHRPYPHAGRDDLRKAREIYDPAFFIEAFNGRQRFATVSQVVIRVIFRDYNSVFGSYIGDPPASFRRKGRPGRILECGDNVNQLRTVFFYRGFKRVRQNTVFIAFYAYRNAMIRSYRLQSAQECGVFHKHYVARVDQRF